MAAVSVKFAKAKPEAKIPARVSGSAGLDIYACFSENELEIAPNSTRLIPTGLRCAIDPDYFMLLEERGSTGSKGIKRSAGVVDADFRGEIFVAITNANRLPLVISKLDQVCYTDEVIYYPYTKAIAQGIILPVPKLKIEEISEEELLAIPSNRGEGALGSSNK